MSPSSALRERVDPEALVALDDFLRRTGPGGLGAIADLAARRERADEVLRSLVAEHPPSDAVVAHDRDAPGPQGEPAVPVRIYRPRAAQGARPGLLFIHGGGMIMGSLDSEDLLARELTDALGCTTVSVGYRLAPEHPHPAPVEDCYAALRWTADNAEEVGVDRDRIALFGPSGGGGLAAGTALIARDRGGPPLVLQALIYPMLDDRNDRPSSHEIRDLGIWDRAANEEAWRMLLGDRRGRDDVPPYAAPSRATDLADLPPTYLDVGELDLFRDEDIDYAARLMRAGVPTELHVDPGAYHAAELLAPESALGARIIGRRLDALRRAFSESAR
ncbi:alpha/beta hydrolase [Capillimicrobium parvum]|uniref:Carboxylesterase NlhH n=1 Tax=Capillimicrobium parvum TaxID=2884022 RepID=A0A9E7C051_9ACTN|nr:alpha/beta hydrolase [Capillimicrobium parvum]UGS36016.1 Carboxylesterase NlhH [Capillimicrobium parvum]